MLGLASRCRINDMEKHSAVLETAAGFARLDAYLQSCNNMAALGYVYTFGNQTLHIVNAVQVGMPPALNS